MKKSFLFVFAFIAGISISSGQASWGVQIGHTCYDLQTNAAIRNGLVSKPNGTMAAVWIQNHSCTTPQPDPADRGIGYNYYNGASWVYGINGECGIPHGCASGYVGWPNIVWSDSMDEIVITHTPLKITRRPIQGSGAWSTTTLPFTYPYGGDVWPRAVADGNYIHIISSSPAGVTPGGVTRPAIYYRSSDGGMTWDITNLLVPGMDDTTVIGGIGADSYAIDARNGTVAFTAGGWGEDWIMWKSTANGDIGTWSFTIIAPFDTAGKLYFGPNSYEVWTYDDAHAVTVDNNGMVHASTGQIVLEVNSLGVPTGSLFPLGDDGLYYWNENMSAPLIVAGLVDLPNWTCTPTPCPPDGDPSSGIGNNFPIYYLGVTSMSQISVDQTGNPYIVYAGMVEWTSNTGDTSGQSFRDLYLVYSPDGGCTWSKPINIAGHPLLGNVDDGSSGTGFEEDVYPMTNKMIWADNRIHIVWQEDSEPSTELQGGGPTAINYMMYYSFDVTTLPFDTGALVVCSGILAVTPLSSQICAGDSVVLTASGVDTYSWSPSGSLSAGTGDTVIAFPSATTTYTIVGTDTTTGIVDSATVTVTILGNTPAAGFTAGSTSGCDTLTTTFINTSTGSTGYMWSFPGGTPSTSTVANPSVTYNAPGAYDVELIAIGCGTNDTLSTAGYITIDSLPGIFVTPSSAICFGSSVILTATGGNSYAWSPAAGLSGTSGAVVTAAPTTTTTYVVIGTDTNGCSNTASVAVTIYPLPTISVNPPSGVICDSGLVSLTANGAITYSWSPSTGLNVDTGAIVDASPSFTTTYTVTGTDNNGCSGAVSITVVAANSPTITVNPASPAICPGEPVTLTANGGTTYTWSPPQGLSSTVGASVVASPDSTTTYTVISVDANGCSGTSSITVSVNPFVGSFSSDKDTVDLAISFFIQFTDNTSGSTSWSWNFGDGNFATIQNPPYNYFSEGIYTVVLIVSNGTCTDTVQKTIVVIKTTGISEDLNESLKIYPNPAAGMLIIQSNGIKIESIKLINSLGQIVLDVVPEGTNKLDISKLTAGNYIVQIETEKGVVSKNVDISR
ncbi:MAG: T9SS type A sorting domain-containing protein [Cytophagales bacterium]|nr:T9SS type A sorting domain-containing protein [Cytophagales bacterium]